MKAWQTQRLGDLVDEGGGSIQTGPFGSQLHASDYVPEGIPCIMPANMKNNRVDVSEIARISEHDAKRLKRHIVQTGDIVYSRRGDVTQKALIREHENGFFCGTGCLLLRPGKKIDPAFLTYYLSTKTYQSWIASQAVGATMPNLNTGILNRVSFCAPDKDDQERIASVLAALDAKIELNQRINGELEGLAKLLYDYWFAQFDFPMTAAQAAALGKPKLAGHPYSASGGKMIYNENLKREIPEGWRDGTAESLFIFNPSVSLRDGIVAGFFAMDAVPTRGFMTKAVQRKAFSGGTKFANGDVVVARITPCLENGKTALITQLIDDEVGFGSTEFIVMRGRPRSLSAFGASLARSVHFRKFAILNMTGTSGRKRIEASVLKAFPLPIPSGESLAAFEQICEPMFQKMTLNEKETQELTQLRDWLLPMLMNGQVTVQDSVGSGDGKKRKAA